MTGPPPDPVLGFTPQDPVRWLQPGVLTRTGLNLTISTVLGEFADKRELQAVAPAELLTCESLGLPDESELWLDYVSDLADGFPATMTVAHLLGRDELAVDVPGSGAQLTRRGRLLVMGGDEVYPLGSVAGYHDRLVGPYRAALPYTDAPHPRVLAVPGNHDWYDGLTSFLRTFGGVKRLPAVDEATGVPKHEHRWIGGWQTAQRRSYFAVELPQRWWLWGIDIQLDTYIDDPQLDYFRRAAGLLEPGDAVILCSAKPSWVDAGEGQASWRSYDTLDFVERELIEPFGAHLRLSLTGDKHHYARYESIDPDIAGAQKLIAGGGGAYLSATHHLPEELRLPPDAAPEPKGPAHDYVLARGGSAVYPSTARSRQLRWGALRLGWRNGAAFPALVGAGYALWALVLVRPGDPVDGLGDLASRFARPVAPLALLLLLVAALKAFTHDRRARAWPLALVHVLLHAVAVALLVWLGERVVTGLLDEPLTTAWRWAVVVATGVLGALVGCWMLALYLVLADRFDVNTNELFAAQGIEDHKCFLRIHIDAAGDLTIYPVAVDRICRRWVRGPGTGGAGDGRPLLVPAPGHEPAVALIEPPVVVRREPG